MSNRYLYEDRDEIRLLDLAALFTFKSDSSISFKLGRYADSMFWSVGFVDVHYPCEGHIKAHLRVLIQKGSVSHEQRVVLVKQMFDALGIPKDEAYEATFIVEDVWTELHQPVNREGMTDRLY
jgi:hypothetical protein